jgi:hypothetical protein
VNRKDYKVAIKILKSVDSGEFHTKQDIISIIAEIFAAADTQFNEAKFRESCK